MAKRTRPGLESRKQVPKDFAISYNTVWRYPGFSETRFNGMTIEQLTSRYPNNPNPRLVAKRINAMMADLLPRMEPGEKLTYQQIEMILGNGWTYVATKTKPGRQWIADHPAFIASHPKTKWNGNNRVFVNPNTNEVISYGRALEIAKGRLLPNAKWNLIFSGYAIDQSPKVFGVDVEGDTGGKKKVKGMYAPKIPFTLVRGSIPITTEKDCRLYIDAVRGELFIIEIQFVLMEYTG